MDFNKDFIPLALRTESDIAPLTVNPVVFDFVMDAAIAIGNMADMLKKLAAYNKPINLADWNNYASNLNGIIPFLTEMNADAFKAPEGTAPMNLNTRLFHGIFGLFTESTELMEALQVARLTGNWDIPNLKEEIGDQQWYQAILVDELKGDMVAIQETVIAKLRARYPEKYSDANAINRDLTTERQILENGA